MEILEIFPSNGLDRSILAPVLVGLGFLAFFAETWGWPFIGLVVPGYLASIWTSAPVTAATVVGESLGTYVLARAIGQWIPRTGAWSAVFGRERFFLVVLSSLCVRLISEGYLLPSLAEHYRFRHASELYSLGLVLVPLIANSFWNVGVLRGAFHSTVITSLTYAVLNYGLLPYTNLSLSRFELTYESVALDFLQAGKAYLVILTGTLLAARANVMYGWDFNGILVPGLLAAAWYSPLKLVTTLSEGMIVAFVAQQVIKLPPLSRQLIEGPRRVVLAFVVGFAMKAAIGYLGMWFWSGERMTDFYGFGYVLPSLVAVKIWQLQDAARVVMPTLRVSFAGFLLGNVIGYGLQMVYPAQQPSAPEAAKVSHSGRLAAELTLQSSWPERGRMTEPEDERLTHASKVVRALMRGDADGLRRAQQLSESVGLELARCHDATSAAWWSLRSRRTSGRRRGPVPAVAVRDGAAGSGMVVAHSDGRGDLASLAAVIAGQLDAGVVLVLPHGLTAATERRWAQVLADASGWTVMARLRGHAEFTSVRIRRLDSSAAARLKDMLGARAMRDGTWQEFRLDPQQSSIAAAGSAERPELKAWPQGLWQGLRENLPARNPRPARDGMVLVDALRAFGQLFAPAMTEWGSGLEPAPHVLALSEHLGFGFARARDGETDALVLYRRQPTSPQEWFVWVARRGRGQLAVSTPVATGSQSLLDSARVLMSLSHASHMLLGDVERAGEPGEPRGALAFRRSYYQRAHELLLANGARVLQLRRMPTARGAVPEGVVLTTGDVVKGQLGIPDWTAELQVVFGEAGIQPLWYDASQRLFPLRGAVDPVLSYARRFAPSRAVLAWIGTETASRWRLRRRPQLEAVLERVAMRIKEADVARELAARTGKSARGVCRIADLFAATRLFYESHNPHTSLHMARLGSRCRAELVRDTETQSLYLVAHNRSLAAACRLDNCADPRPDASLAPEAARRAVVSHSPVLTMERDR